MYSTGLPWVFLHAALDALVPAYFGQGNGDILLDELECAGNETKLINCPHDGVGVHNCRHSEDIGVVCESKVLFV